MNKNLKSGALTELKCQMFLIEHDFIVSKPILDNARYDLILDYNNKLYRIQIKTSAWKDESHTAFVFNGYSQHSIGNGNKRMKYTNKEIDFFMTEKEDIFYLYPAEEEGFVSKCLRLKSETNSSLIKWAKDYEFEEVIKNF